MRFFWENPNPHFPNPKTDFTFFGANPQTNQPIKLIKSTLWVDSSDQIQIRIFEMSQSERFLGKDLKKSILTSGFPNKGSTCHLFTFVDCFYTPTCHVFLYLRGVCLRRFIFQVIKKNKNKTIQYRLQF